LRQNSFGMGRAVSAVKLGHSLKPRPGLQGVLIVSHRWLQFGDEDSQQSTEHILQVLIAGCLVGLARLRIDQAVCMFCSHSS
jgi:hypothetical protein